MAFADDFDGPTIDMKAKKNSNGTQFAMGPDYKKNLFRTAAILATAGASLTVANMMNFGIETSVSPQLQPVDTTYRVDATGLDALVKKSLADSQAASPANAIEIKAQLQKSQKQMIALIGSATPKKSQSKAQAKRPKSSKPSADTLAP